jgi:hypothetical protein
VNKTKFILVTFKERIPIDADEIAPLMKAISNGEVKILRQGIFGGTGFDTIVQDKEYMEKFRDAKKYEIREGKITEYPHYEDIFADVRALMVNNFKQLK